MICFIQFIYLKSSDELNCLPVSSAGSEEDENVFVETGFRHLNQPGCIKSLGCLHVGTHVSLWWPLWPSQCPSNAYRICNYNCIDTNLPHPLPVGKLKLDLVGRWTHSSFKSCCLLCWRTALQGFLSYGLALFVYMVIGRRIEVPVYITHWQLHKLCLQVRESIRLFLF